MRTTYQTQDGHAFRAHLRLVFGERVETFSRDLLGMLYELWLLGTQVGSGDRCEACGEAGDVRKEDSRTQYHWDGTGEDPNAPLHLCRDCAETHHANWDEMWREYNAGRL